MAHRIKAGLQGVTRMKDMAAPASGTHRDGQANARNLKVMSVVVDRVRNRSIKAERAAGPRIIQVIANTIVLAATVQIARSALIEIAQAETRRHHLPERQAGSQRRRFRKHPPHPQWKHARTMAAYACPS